jgi:hypothetical protein
MKIPRGDRIAEYSPFGGQRQQSLLLVLVIQPEAEAHATRDARINDTEASFHILIAVNI